MRYCKQKGREMTSGVIKMIDVFGFVFVLYTGYKEQGFISPSEEQKP